PRRTLFSQNAMRILVTGGTGFIGAPLCRALRGAGHVVTVVSRDPEAAGTGTVDWGAVPDAVRQTDAIVNLAGEPIAAHRWRTAQKERIRESRVGATRALVAAIDGATPRPRV